jgi:hypothetical protein
MKTKLRIMREAKKLTFDDLVNIIKPFNENDIEMFNLDYIVRREWVQRLSEYEDSDFDINKQTEFRKLTYSRDIPYIAKALGCAVEQIEQKIHSQSI